MKKDADILERPVPIVDSAAMREAEAEVIAAGVSADRLMEIAGRAVADTCRARFAKARRIAVLCGPGANGGDGYVAGRVLREAGLDVRMIDVLGRGPGAGAAARARAAWAGPVQAPDATDIAGADVVVDAVFGIGLTRPLMPEVIAALAAAHAGGVPVLAVDVPSGVDADTGENLGAPGPAAVTVTFEAPKPGHVLEPGASLSGDLDVAPIGVDLTGRSTVWLNGPGLWRAALPRPSARDHKYDRGHVLVVSGPALRTGASRLSARAALVSGAGLVTLAGERDALLVHAARLDAVMLAEAGTPEGFAVLVAAEPRYRTVVIGPAAGVGADTAARVAAAASAGRALILDADALTSFAGRADELAALVRPAASVVVTPHAGEFARLFHGHPLIPAGARIARARAAAAVLGAVVLLKGADTVVAAPDGSASVMRGAPPTLATAGSGDVLAGIVAGLISGGMAPFEAASAAVFIHAAAARSFGRGLDAETLVAALPRGLDAAYGA